MDKRKLLIVWSSGEIEVANKLVLLYGSVMLERGYWDEAHLMIWGPSAKLLAENIDLQKKVQAVRETGVELSACVACTDDYNITQQFNDLDIPTVHTGAFMTQALQSDWKVITF